MKASLLALLLIFSGHLALADNDTVKVYDDFPADKCEGLGEILQVFADDLNQAVRDKKESAYEAIDAFDWVLIELNFALSKEPADCDGALKFAKKRHGDFKDAFAQNS